MGPDELADDDRKLWLVGRIARVTATMEYASSALLAAYIKNPPVGLVIAFGNPISQTFDQLAAIASNPNSRALPHIERVKDVVSGARSVWAERNHVIHGLWLGDDPVTVSLYRRGGAVQGRDWTVAALEALLERATKQFEAVRDLNNDVVDG